MKKTQDTLEKRQRELLAVLNEKGLAQLRKEAEKLPMHERQTAELALRYIQWRSGQ